MKLKYVTPLLEEMLFVDEDVITSSPSTTPPTPLDPNEGIEGGTENQDWY